MNKPMAPDAPNDDKSGFNGSAGHLKALLRAGGFRPGHVPGQNFLVSSRVFSDILQAACVAPSDTILEIGTGAGRLTALLAERAKKVISVEIDAGLHRLASARLAGRDNVILLHGDFLQDKHHIDPAVTRATDRLCRGGPVKVVCNLPYHISSPAIANLLEWRQPVSAIYVMLQREAAERLTAGAGCPEYGPLSVIADYHADTVILFHVPPSAFWPRPEVTSAFSKIIPRPPEKEAKDYRLFSELVNVLFRNRRKMLRKALQIGWGKEAAMAVMEKTGVCDEIRPEKLRTEEFVSIADALAELDLEPAGTGHAEE